MIDSKSEAKMSNNDMEKIDYLEVATNEEDSDHHQKAQTVLIGLVSVLARSTFGDTIFGVISGRSSPDISRLGPDPFFFCNPILRAKN